LGARIAAIGPCYEFFRITRLKIYSFADAAFLTYDTSGVTKVGIVNGYMFIAFDPEPDAGTGTVTSVTQAAQFGHFRAGNIRSTPKINLGRKDLFGATPGKWYATVSTGSHDFDVLSAGTIHYGNVNQISTGSAPTQFLFADGEIEFKGAVTPTLSYNKDGTFVVKTPVMDETKSISEDDGVMVTERIGNPHVRTCVYPGEKIKIEKRTPITELGSPVYLITPQK
jgi:hypothetical protein